jgi:lactate dehydrogenase-like 2-hydroxyacid dehydrogenase
MANADPSQPGGNSETSNVIQDRAGRLVCEPTSSRQQDIALVLAGGPIPQREKLKELCARHQTRGMIGAREFAAMRSTAVRINLGRGPIISEQALVHALPQNRIRGAALDVFDLEPLPAGHPFYKLANVLLITRLIGWTKPCSWS